MNIEILLSIYLSGIAPFFLGVSLLEHFSGSDLLIKDLVSYLFLSILWPIAILFIIGMFFDFIFSLPFWNKTIIKGRKQPEEENPGDCLVYEED